MSKKKKKRQVSLFTYIYTFILAFFVKIKNTFFTMTLESSTTITKNTKPSKKEARLLNKQSKLMAEYRLVNDKDGEEGPPDAKKIKLEDKNNMLSPEEFKQLKKELAERKKLLTQLPRFTLTQLGIESTVFGKEYSTRTPLLLPDIQHLITYAYGGNSLIPPPSRWCTLQKPNRLLQLVVLIVDGVGLNEFVDNEHLFPRTMKIFGGSDASNRCLAEVLDPQWYGGTVEREIARWGLFEIGEEEKDKEDDQQHANRVLSQLGSMFPIINTLKEDKTPKDGVTVDKFPRTSLLLSLPQLIQEGYPLPIPSTPMTRESNVKFVQTAREYAPVTSCSPMFAIDCEMCGAVGDPNALAKIGIVDEENKVVYESFVRPKSKIIDYRTKWSGINAKMLEGVETRLKNVQEKIKEIVKQHPDCILVGQSLNCDLNSMRMIHPYIIDTSVCFNLTGIEGRKSKLKDLVLNLLDEEIQGKKEGKEGHCPVEDAIAAMKLVKAKLANDISFGNAVKNPTTGTYQPTVVSSEPVAEKLDQYFKEKRNTLEKDVLVIHHRPSPSDSQSDQSSDDEQQKSEKKLTLPLLYHKTNNKPPSQEKSKITVNQSPSNRATIKLLQNCLFDNFMNIAHYKINSSKDLKKELTKLDKRVQKLFNKMCDNSMIVVVCSKEGVKTGEEETDDDGDKKARRNNGVCFVRVKVNSSLAGNKRRRDD